MTIFFFFFQAEDGIRDYKVTGVQTCALPICHLRPGHERQSPGTSQNVRPAGRPGTLDRKSTRLNSSHLVISHAVFSLKKKTPARMAMTSSGASLASRITPGCSPARLKRSPLTGRACGGLPVSAITRLFFFNDTATTEIYTLSLHDALPI